MSEERKIHGVSNQDLIIFDEDYNITYLHPNILSSLSRLLLKHIRERAWNVPMSEEWTREPE